MDKTKIFASDCHMYIASRGATPDTAVAHAAFPGTAWKEVGFMKQGSVKLSTDKFEIDLHTGEKQQLGVTLKLEADALETDAAKLTELEGMVNYRTDIILKPVNSTVTRVWKLLGFNMSVGLAGPMSMKDALTLPLSGQVNGAKVSDCFDEITLT
jgi:hypothetical protein